MTISFQADLSKIDLYVSAMIENLKEDIAVTQENEYKIRLVCKELLTNIISYSGADTVLLNSSFENKLLKLTFNDNGKGFDYSKIIERDVTSEDNIMQDGGRGIFLVRLMTDGFSYSRDGRSAEVTINLE